MLCLNVKIMWWIGTDACVKKSMEVPAGSMSSVLNLTNFLLVMTKFLFHLLGAWEWIVVSIYKAGQCHYLQRRETTSAPESFPERSGMAAEELFLRSDGIEDILLR
jgi:hypothetical protein